ISVTTFFRDGGAFQILAKNILPQLFADRQADDTIRVWISGCATGEEAYSFAILLLEEAPLHQVRPQIQIFGSDLDARALSSRRGGRSAGAKGARGGGGGWAPFLGAGGPPLPRGAGCALSRAVRRPFSPKGPAVFPCRPDFLPQRPHLSRS